MQHNNHSNYSLGHFIRKHFNAMATTHMYNIDFRLHFTSVGFTSLKINKVTFTIQRNQVDYAISTYEPVSKPFD